MLRDCNRASEHASALQNVCRNLVGRAGEMYVVDLRLQAENLACIDSMPAA